MAWDVRGSVPFEFVRQALQEPIRRQINVVPILQRAKLPENIIHGADGQVSIRQFAVFWRILARALDDEFCWMDARTMKPGSFAFMAQIAMQQHTVEQGIEQALKFLSLIFANKTTYLIQQHSVAEIVLNESQEEPFRPFCYFTFWMYVHGLTCWLASRRVPILAVELRCEKPENADDYRLMFSENLSFSKAQTRIIFAADCLQQPIRRSADELKRFINNAPRNIMVKYRDPLSLTSKTRHLLNQQTPSLWPDADQVAEHFHISVATLRRRLAEEGQSFQQIKDKLRANQAMRALADTQKSFVDIANELGFADVSAFYKAFRKWTGTQPGHYRQLLLG
ncbi:AraC family transcriptional regulator [Pseudomonas sp. F1_0610]|uniref:AraC family transcriptional regulator n=1 Tax=Pseudomonas sp. F1_0610 TaxID=3114284 RepID=UPI0039C0B5CC